MLGWFSSTSESGVNSAERECSDMATRIQTKPEAKKEPAVRLQWKRGYRANLKTSDRMCWESQCGRFKIEKLDSLVGLGTTFYAISMAEGRDTGILYRGKSRPEAEAACRRSLRPAAV